MILESDPPYTELPTSLEMANDVQKLREENTGQIRSVVTTGSVAEIQPKRQIVRSSDLKSDG
jgi:hypothetical protein